MDETNDRVESIKKLVTYYVPLRLQNHLTVNYRLTNPPNEERNRELWLQHAAGFILFQDIREYAIQKIPIDTDNNTKEKIIKGIDDAVYGLMMVLDGVTGSLKNDDYSVNLETTIKLQGEGKTIQEINTFNGDGMCMGFHSWKEDDFGDADTCPFRLNNK